MSGPGGLVYVRDGKGTYAWVVSRYETIRGKRRPSGTFELINGSGQVEEGFPKPGSFLEKDIGRLLRRNGAGTIKRCALRAGEAVEDRLPFTSKLLLKLTHPYTIYQP
jgi:hypothetical protein